MGKKMMDEILSGSFTEIDYAQEKIKYKVIDHVNKFKANQKVYELKEKLIITYSHKRAEKDKADRQRLVDKANGLLNQQSKIAASNKRGGKKYLKNTAPQSWVLDEAAIKKDEAFDGYYGIVTSETELEVEDILDAYHSLWKIEESFRIMKSTLEVRPIFHWTEKRIKGHFVMCFLAFLLERTLEIKLKDLEGASPESIREAINSLNFAQVEIDTKKYYIKTKGTQLSNKILRKLRINPPKNIMAVEDFSP
ncbi:MAG: IS1634 family transposase, partial [Actinomycetota bacterium]